MKIVILTPKSHFQSPVVLRDLCSHFQGSDREFHVIVTPKLPAKAGKGSPFRRFLARGGVLYLFMMLWLTVKYRLHAIGERMARRSIPSRRFLKPLEICEHFGVDCREFFDVNSAECLDYIRGISPDVILSLFFNQIIRPDLVGLATKACLNLHPSYLPEYRGTSPVLWMLSERASTGGITVHHVTQGIDEGNIVLQTRFDIAEDDSAFVVYTRAASEGAKLLIELFSGEEIPEGTDQGTPPTETYRSITKEAFRNLLRNHPFGKFR